MLSGILIFNQKGENLIFRAFRNDCRPRLADVFRVSYSIIHPAIAETLSYLKLPFNLTVLTEWADSSDFQCARYIVLVHHNGLINTNPYSPVSYPHARIHDLQPCQAREYLPGGYHEKQCQCCAGVRIPISADCAWQGVLWEVR
jgi:hypothetical protein